MPAAFLGAHAFQHVKAFLQVADRVVGNVHCQAFSLERLDNLLHDAAVLVIERLACAQLLHVVVVLWRSGRVHSET